MRTDLSKPLGIASANGSENTDNVNSLCTALETVQLDQGSDELNETTLTVDLIDFESAKTRVQPSAMREVSCHTSYIYHQSASQHFFKELGSWFARSLTHDYYVQVMLEIPKVKWTDIGGMEDVKQQLQEAVIWPQKHGDRMKSMGATDSRSAIVWSTRMQ